MAVPMSPVVWSKTSSLDHAGLEEYKKETRLSFEERLQSNHSFLYSTVIRRSIEESRTAFLNLSLAEGEPEELETINEPEEVKEIPDHEDKPRRPPCKRISYKIKRSSSVYKKAKAPIKGSLVAELTSKFDMMIAEKKHILSDPKFARLVRRVNSQKLQPGDSIKLHKKPSVKMKFDEKPSFVTKKPSIVRKVSVKQLQKTPSLEKNCIRAKVTHLQDETDSKGTNVKPEVVKRSSNVNVKATIERFEKCKSDIPQTYNFPKEKPKVPEKKFTAKTMDIISKNSTKKFKVKIEKDVDQKVERKAEIKEEVPVINIPITKPKSSTEIFICKGKPEPDLRASHSESDLSDFKPNTSFLWRNNDKSPTQLRPTFEEDDYDVVNPPPEEPKQKIQPPIPPRPFELKKVKPKMPEPEKDYEELPEHCEIRIHSYEYFKSPPNYEDIEQREDDGYEAVNPRVMEMKENIYEVLPCRQDNPPPLPRRQEELSPPALPSKNSLYSTQQEVISNGYESIGSAFRFRVTCDDESSYEVLSQVAWGSGSNRDSVVSSDQQSNSLYGRSIPSWTEDVLNYKTTSVSSSDRSDEWEDLPDEDDKIEPGFILVREKPKISKKTSGWSQQLREQWTKTNSEIDDTGSYHHYESVRNAHNESHYDSDSFDSDSDYYDNKPNMHDSGVDMGNTQLPEPPNNQPYVFTRLASAGKRMKRLLTKNDITKSLSRMTKRKSRTDLDDLDKTNKEEKSPSLDKRSKSRSSIKLDVESPISKDVSAQEVGYQNVPYGRNSTSSTDTTNEAIYEKQKNKKGFLTKFRRSMSLTAESANELTQELTNKPKSTFYLTGPIDIDEPEDNNCDNRKSSVPTTPARIKYAKPVLVRPQVPPPPLPTHHSNIELRIPNDNDAKRTTSWYAECGLFKNDMPLPNLPKRPNTCWYAEVGLYQSGPLSTPSTSSAENSGTSSNFKSDFILTSAEEYYNFRNGNTYYNDSICSITSNESKPDKNYAHISGEMQQLLQDEPLYQLYDAALSESYCKGETLDLDYEEVSNEVTADSQLRPSAMELILKNGNSVSITRSLWCEIPEVKNSAVLSTLSLPQKKLQEAKFEMMTSEASYLNSLNVLTSHFIKNLRMEDCLTDDESQLIFGQIPSVKNCSEKLLQDMEKCWQDNILLHNICDVIQKHADENFDVYVQYCENQILLDSTLKKLKDKPGFYESLQQLETSTTCQALTLYSFLMLPMQRITRWPLLLDAVLKRLSVDDKEYGTCQQALATINKIVKQCNEAARQKERQTEMLALKSRIHFGKHSSLVNLISDHRYLVKSGPVTQMVTRGDDAKLTFGKRFTKLPLHLFLFNDLFLVTKYRANEDNYTVIHHCQRSFVDVNVDVAPSISIKDTHGRHLIFLTILENQDEKLVEMLLSCCTDSDKERWISALSPKISQDPEETLYERWDCPQVTAIHDYLANQPDEVSLCRGDIIYVNRKMADGWYHGEKIRDGECGWFPSNYVQEIANPHVRARNLRQRYRLLAFSENYLKTKGQNEHL